MYSFNDLHPKGGDGTPDSFAYWLCRLHKQPRSGALTADDFSGAMSRHFDVEEQAYTPKMLNSSSLIPKYLTPIAPVTLAHRWSPFPLAFSLLGEPECHGITNESHGESSFAVWTPRYLGKDKFPKAPPDEVHFTFLIRLATSAAMAAKCKILLVGSPGWSYKTALERPMNPETAILMHEAGYLYTERVAR